VTHGQPDTHGCGLVNFRGLRTAAALERDGTRNRDEDPIEMSWTENLERCEDCRNEVIEDPG